VVGSGGADILIGGRGNDTLAVSDLTFKRIVGGNGTDTLRLDGRGHLLDLSTVPDNRIVNIEQIDITGSGNNTLTLNFREVLNSSSHSNTLIVRRDAGDTVNRGSGWSQQANETINSNTFEVFKQGEAILKIQKPANAVPIVTIPTGTATYTENAAPILPFLPSTVTDADMQILNGGRLYVTNANADPNDRLTIHSSLIS
jgi:Ca2+-binding RTX toxin-like protein